MPRRNQSGPRGRSSARPTRRTGTSHSSGPKKSAPKRTSFKREDNTAPKGASFKREGNSGPKKASFRREGNSGPKKASFRREDNTASKGGSFRREDNPTSKRASFKRGDNSTSKKASFKPEDNGASKRASFKREANSTSKRASFKREDNTAPRRASFRREDNTSSESRPYRRSSRSSGTSRPKPPRKGASSGHRRHEIATEGKSDKVRLNKYIANSGVSSRREADELIKMGLISVNGKTVTELGYKIEPGDEVRYEDKVLRAEKPVYLLLNKPKGFITTTDDPQERKTVMHLIGDAVKQRIYPVGRLDRNTTGLLLLTNDGDLADKLMHPSFNVRKIYKVELDKSLTKGDLQKIAEGVKLEEGKAVVDEVAIVSEDGRTVGIELHIGWNRVVRRIFESLGYEVMKLDRTSYAGLDKKDLPRGEWRFLTKQEIIQLKHFK